MISKLKKMYEDQVFPTIYHLKDMEKVIKSNLKVVLVGRVLTIQNIYRVVNYLKENGKIVIVDMDLIGGLKADGHALDFISKQIKADGIISTHSEMIIHAKSADMVTIFKVFAFDEFSTETAIKNISHCSPDIIELLPGIAIPCFISKMKEKTNAYIDVSGYLGDDESIPDLFKMGISAIHTGNHNIWNMNFRD